MLRIRRAGVMTVMNFPPP